MVDDVDPSRVFPRIQICRLSRFTVISPYQQRTTSSQRSEKRFRAFGRSSGTLKCSTQPLPSQLIHRNLFRHDLMVALIIVYADLHDKRKILKTAFQRSINPARVTVERKIFHANTGGCALDLKWQNLSKVR